MSLDYSYIITWGIFLGLVSSERRRINMVDEMQESEFDRWFAEKYLRDIGLFGLVEKAQLNPNSIRSLNFIVGLLMSIFLMNMTS